MNAGMMSQMIPAGPIVDSVAKMAAGKGTTPADFAGYVERQLEARKQGSNMLLGEKIADAAAKADQLREEVAAKHQDPGGEMAALLATIMARLQQMTEDYNTTTPQDWVIPALDPLALQQIALAAGIDGAALGGLRDQLNANGGTIKLTDLFAFLGRQFADRTQPIAITVPETDLPLLETLLARLDVAMDQIQALDGKVVTGDDQLDLQAFLAGLGDLESDQTTMLRDWEKEQLQAMLGRAGASEEVVAGLFREPPGQAVRFSLERFRQMLADGIQSVIDQRPQPEPATLFAGLQDILSQAAVAEDGAGWAPVVEESLTAIYQELQGLVDFSKITLQQATPPTPEGDQLPGDNAEFLLAEGVAENGPQAWQTQVGGDANESTTGQDTGDRLSLAAMLQTLQPRPDEKGGAVPFVVGDSTVTMADNSVADPAVPGVPRLHPANLQQAVDQIRRGVIHGLRNNEHHLVLKLHPPELGEVKVDLTVHHDQVSVSFAMENSRVKESLEANMQQFQDSLSQRGFTLGECSVSVGQQQDNNDLWQRFEMTFSEQEGGVESLADLAEEVLYQRGVAAAENGGAISLFV